MSAPKKKKTIQKTAEKTGLGMDLLDGVRKGNVRAIARMISLAEAAKSESRPALAEIFRRAGNAHVIGITGVPGSGKSTLLKCLTGATPLDRGEVRLDGRPLGAFTLRELACRRAVLSQGASVTFPFLVTEVVAMGRAPHGGNGAGPADAAIIRRALEYVDAWHLCDRVFPTLSGSGSGCSWRGCWRRFGNAGGPICFWTSRLRSWI